MKKFSQLIVIGLSIVILGNIFGGCGKKEETVKQSEVKAEVESTVTEEKQEKVTIRTISQFSDTDPAGTIYEAKIDEFRGENPNITVEDESGMADEVWKAKIATDFAAGNEPDVIFTFIGIDAKFIIGQGKVVSIEEIRKEYPDYASNIAEGVLNSVKEFDGNTYAVPVRGFYEGLFINKEMFYEYGLELPTDWGKFETAINVLKEKGKIPVAAALGHMPDYWIEHLVLSQGGVDVHRNTDIASTKDDWIKGLSYFKTLYDMEAFPTDTNSISSDSATELFINEEAAMMLEGNWVIDEFPNPDNITVLPIPTVPGGKKDSSDIISGFSSGWYITKKAWDDPVKRDAAVKYVQKMTSTDTIRDFVASGGTPAAEVGEVAGLPSTAILGFKMQVGAKNMDMPANSWLPKPAWDKLVSKIPSIATGEEDSAEVLEEVINLVPGT